MLKRWDEQASGASGESGLRERVVLIGLDACDPRTVRRMARSGRLPNIARFMAQSSRAPVRNPYGLFVGATWANFATAVGPARHGFYCWDMIDPATGRYRLKPPGVAHPPFWDALGAAGRRVCVIDVPHTRFPAPVNGLGIAEWGCHDRHYGFHTQPPERAGALAAQFGLHPALGIYPYAERDFAADDHVHRAGALRTPAEQAALSRDLVEGARTKARLALSCLGEEAWDLFACVFGEAHAVGHQSWHLHDPAHSDHDPAARRAAGDPVAAVYEALDEAVGELLGAAGPDTTVMLLFSHGMAAHHDGTHLLEEVLRRLDGHYRGESGPGDRLERVRQAIAAAAERLARQLRLPDRVRRGLGYRLGPRPFASAARRARQAFYLAPNNHVHGGIRFNLAGREAAGWVTGEEAERLADRLEADLKMLVNVDTGGPVVRVLRRTDHHHPRTPGDTMPDLIIDWERGAPIETVRSEAVGTVRASYYGWRTGDHRPSGMLLVRAPGQVAPEVRPKLRIEDVPASLAARLGVPLQNVDGFPIPWLAAPEAEPATASGRHS